MAVTHPDLRFRPGDYFLTQIGGPVGLAIRVAQGLCGDWSRYTHAGVILDDGTIIAAQPGGARIEPLSSIASKKHLALGQMPLTMAERAEVVAVARSFEGVPYSFLNYLSLTLVTLGIRPKWLLRYVAGTGHVICSQLVDKVYPLATYGRVNLFDDGRFAGDVTPGDLAHVGLIQHVGTGPYRRP